jgi:hypothetical protein
MEAELKAMFRPVACAVLASVLVLSACSLRSPTVQPSPPTPPSPRAAPSQTALPTWTAQPYPPAEPSVGAPTTVPVSQRGDLASFSAGYAEPTASIPAVFAGGGYSLPLDLARVQGLDQIAATDAQKVLLAKNGFVVTAPKPGEYREFYQVYQSMPYWQVPVFVTTDSVYHVYHLMFDKMLRDLETDYFIATLKSLTGSMLAATHQQYESLHGTPLEEPARRNVAYFGVAAQLLGLPEPVPQEATSLVDAELALITADGGASISPIWDRPDLPEDMKLTEDYGQYIPRGHYTRSEDLKRYFRAMMWYGRLTFRMDDDFETRRALLLTQALRSTTAADGTPAVNLWESVYDPTVFIVGKADDLGYHEYGALSDKVFGPNLDPAKFADPALYGQFRQAAESLPSPQVNSMWVWIWQDTQQVTKGFRFMGQRFTLDEYVFGQLIWRKVGTPSEPRDLPKALDFLAAMGSQEAYAILKDAGEAKYANYDSQMDKVKREIAALGTDSWTQNLYWTWLYSFQPLIEPKGKSFPPFMQTQAWTRKDLQCALGSWTELKHDTILYAKQVEGAGGGDGLDFLPHGYVEPNPEAYARLLALAKMTESGLRARNLLSDETRLNLADLIDELTFLETVATKELVGEVPTDDEYVRIMHWGDELMHRTAAAADRNGAQDRDLSDLKAALVANVATGVSGNALEEGEGQPTRVLVVLPDSPWRVAVGAVYTYYEFKVPSSERMTDKAWQAQLEGGTNPPQPDWTQMFVAP